MLKARNIRKQSFCWQSKDTLWEIRRACKEANESLSPVLSVYLVLTELASNNSSDSFEEFASTVKRMSGAGDKSYKKAITFLNSIGIISEIHQGREKDGKYKKTLYNLLSTDTSRAVTAKEEYLEETPIVEHVISNDISNKLPLKEKVSEKATQESIPPKQYGNKEINILKDFLKVEYPKQLTGLEDRKRLHNLIQACTPRKSNPKEGEWMNPKWNKNFVVFMNEYKAGTEETYLVGSVDKLVKQVQKWREYGPKKATTFDGVWK